MTDPATVDVTFYVQLAPTWFPGSYGTPRLRGAKAVRVTSKRPPDPFGGAVVVKLTVRVARAAFLPLCPEAVVVIPDELTGAKAVEVLAEAPDE
jgi:hypothetical protein